METGIIGQLQFYTSGTSNLGVNLQLFAEGDGLASLMRSRSLGLGSTGRTTPNSLLEQLAMKEVLSDPLNGARRVPINYNEVTGAFDDFKFK